MAPALQRQLAPTGGPSGVEPRGQKTGSNVNEADEGVDVPVPTYMDLIGELERELRTIAPAQCPGLLGELERLKALAWVQLNAQGSQVTRESSQHTDQLLTIPEVSERLSPPVSRVYALAWQGKLPVLRVGKYVRVKAIELAKWIGDHRGSALDDHNLQRYSSPKKGGN